MSNKVGLAVKHTRENMGVTQTELAKKMRVSQPRISAIERGESIPHLEQISDIEKALGVSPGYILRASGRIAPEGDEGESVDLVEVSARLTEAVEALQGVARALGLRTDSSQRHEEARSARGGRKKATGR